MPILRRLLLSLLTSPSDAQNRALLAPLSLSSVLRNGDVLLTEGNTRAAALIKRLTKSTWSHVSIYVGPLEDGPDPRCIVEADIAAGVRAIRLSELECTSVRVLRPTVLTDTDRQRLAEWVVSRIGGEYDLNHAWVLARSLMPVAPSTRYRHVPQGIGATRFVCSTLLANAFAEIGTPILPIRTSATAMSTDDGRYVIPSDFENASGFEVVV